MPPSTRPGGRRVQAIPPVRRRCTRREETAVHAGEPTLRATRRDTRRDTAQVVGIEAGFVALYDGTPCEITGVTAGNKMLLSLLRPEPSGPAIPPPSLGTKPVIVSTFRPQLALAHAQVLRMLGIEPTAPAAPGVITEASITNPRTLWLATALSALHLIYAGAAALAPASSPLAERADMYRRLFAQERQLAAARVDTNQDGVADATRRLNVIQLMRG